MSEPTLFDASPWTRPVPEPEPTLSAGARLRIRQARAIAAGVHPLALTLGASMRMHPDADRSARVRDAQTLTPRCGSCRFRVMVHGGARDFPKCTYGSTKPGRGPRISHGSATDVRSWWPGCTEYEAVPDA